MKIKEFFKKNLTKIILFSFIVLLILPISITSSKPTPTSPTTYHFRAIFIDGGNESLKRVLDSIFINHDINIKSLFTNLLTGVSCYFPLFLCIIALSVNFKNKERVNLIISSINLIYFFVAFILMLWNYLAYILLILAIIYFVYSIIRFKELKKTRI